MLVRRRFLVTSGARSFSVAARMRLCSSSIGDSATRGGRDLLGLGFTVSQVVHDYGHTCQAIARRAIRAQGGDIEVRNTPGKGCTFVIDVPAAAPALDVPGAMRQPAP